MNTLLTDSAGRLFADWRSRAIDLARESGTPMAMPEALWREIDAQGYPLALLREEEGGFGLDPAEGLALVRLAAAEALPLPLGEAMLARLIAARAGLTLPDEGLIALGLAEGKAQITLPYGRAARAVVIAGDRGAAVLEPADLVAGRNLAGEPRDLLSLPADLPFAPCPFSLTELRAMAAILRALALAGACRAALELTLDHARTRKQFGKPLGAFQVLQHNLAQMASEAAAAAVAAESAARAMAAFLQGSADGRALILQAAAAKVRAGRAAGLIAAQSHQIHAAIGVTREHALQAFTRRLWSWRDEHGSERHWAEVLGKAGLDAPDLWLFFTEIGEVMA